MDFNLTLIGQTIAMVVFVWFVMKYIWPPVMGAIEARQATIAEGLAAAERGRSDLASAKDEAQKAVVSARDQARVIIEQANTRATEIVDAARHTGEAEKQRQLDTLRHVNVDHGGGSPMDRVSAIRFGHRDTRANEALLEHRCEQMELSVHQGSEDLHSVSLQRQLGHHSALTHHIDRRDQDRAVARQWDGQRLHVAHDLGVNPALAFHRRCLPHEDLAVVEVDVSRKAARSHCGGQQHADQPKLSEGRSGQSLARAQSSHSEEPCCEGSWPSSDTVGRAFFDRPTRYANPLMRKR